MTDQLYLNVEEVAKMLRLSPLQVRNLVQMGKIAAFGSTQGAEARPVLMPEMLEDRWG